MRQEDQDMEDLPSATEERDAVLPPTLGDVAKRWLLRVSVLALCASFCVHFAGLVLMGVIHLGGSGGGAPTIGEKSGPVEMALGGGEVLQTIGPASLDASVPSVPEDNSSNAPEISISDAGPSDGVSLTMNDGGDVGALGGGGDVSSGSLGAGGSGGGGGGGGGSSFFGVEAAGTRFAFIVDTSASMEGQKFTRLKQELRRSLDRMPETNQFIIVGFSDQTTILGGRREWREASAAGRRKIAPLIETIELGASTLPLGAFKIILGELRPRPDAIYFMTDGEFEESVVQEVAIMNARLANPIPIHCICFASTSGEELMKKIADQSKGSYTFVPGP